MSSYISSPASSPPSSSPTSPPSTPLDASTLSQPTVPAPAVTDQPHLHDVLIIGAGPCGLAVAARLCENTPSAIFTEEEHARYHWIRKHGRRMSLARGKEGVVDLARDGVGMHKGDKAPIDEGSRREDHLKRLGGEGSRHYDTLVLDASGEEWMTQWNRLFRTFEITHLRSPMFFHLDPRDRDGLLAHTYETHRAHTDLKEIAGVVGKELSKHARAQKRRQRERMSREAGKGPKAELEIDERDRKDYFVPSRELFESHCRCVVDRYGLANGLVRQEVVKDVDFGLLPGAFPQVDGQTRLFSVQTNKGVHYARAVVLAVGAGNAPTVPDCELCERVGDEGMMHANRIEVMPHPRVAEKIAQGRKTCIVVVGGGLTSAQLSDLAVRKGVSKVIHLMKSGVKVKPFDVDIDFLSKYKNHAKAIFWSADSDAERSTQIRIARNGGSVTKPYAGILKALQASGRVSLYTHARLHPEGCVFHHESKTWTIATEPKLQELEGVEVDYIYYATGIQSDFATLPFLQTMLEKFPLHGHGGLPCLSEDLMWRGAVRGVGLTKKDERSKVDGSDVRRRQSMVEDVTETDDEVSQIPLFVTGRLASLRLGPGGGNLEGARVGAERIAWALTDIVDAQNEKERNESVRRETAECDACNEDDAVDERGRKLSTVMEERQEAVYRYAVGLGSRFESLDEE